MNDRDVAATNFWKALAGVSRNPRPDWSEAEAAIRAVSDVMECGPVWPYLICHSRKMLDEIGMTKYRQRKLRKIAATLMDEVSA